MIMIAIMVLLYLAAMSDYHHDCEDWLVEPPLTSSSMAAVDRHLNKELSQIRDSTSHLSGMFMARGNLVAFLQFMLAQSLQFVDT